MVICIWCRTILKGKQTMYCSRGCQLKQWKKDNPTKVKQHINKYRKSNLEKHNQRNRNWNENNPEKYKEILKKSFKKQRMKRHKCVYCSLKLTCGNKENMQQRINKHEEVCTQKNKYNGLR